MLLRMDSLCGKPVCLWLPERFKKPNTSTYVQGVEGLTDYTGPVSEGFDVIELPTADYLMFQGEPFAEEDYLAISSAPVIRWNASSVTSSGDARSARVILQQPTAMAFAAW